MSKIVRLFRYEWPLFMVQSLCSIFPDNVVIFKLRGFLCGFFLGSCGKDFRCGRHVVFSNPVNIHLGDHVYIAYGCWLHGYDCVILEDEVMLGPYCVLSSANHVRNHGSFRYGTPKKGPITIGKGSWLAAHVTVLRNVDIGSGTVISANTVVRQNVPADSVFGIQEDV